jgi:hypothetical protein
MLGMRKIRNSTANAMLTPMTMQLRAPRPIADRFPPVNEP